MASSSTDQAVVASSQATSSANHTAVASATKASFQATKEPSVLVPVAPSASSDHTVTVIDRNPTFVFCYLNLLQINSCQ